MMKFLNNLLTCAPDCLCSEYVNMIILKSYLVQLAPDHTKI
jgi:hypothetical protein